MLAQRAPLEKSLVRPRLQLHACMHPPPPPALSTLSRGVLHGDLKAGNVLLQRSARTPFGLCAKVSDFGLSRIMQVCRAGQRQRSSVFLCIVVL